MHLLILARRLGIVSLQKSDFIGHLFPTKMSWHDQKLTGAWMLTRACHSSLLVLMWWVWITVRVCGAAASNSGGPVLCFDCALITDIGVCQCQCQKANLTYNFVIIQFILVTKYKIPDTDNCQYSWYLISDPNICPSLGNTLNKDQLSTNSHWRHRSVYWNWSLGSVVSCTQVSLLKNVLSSPAVHRCAWVNV